MQVSVETLEGLQRKLTISLPSEKVEQEVDARLKKLARTANMKGFRPGKAPFAEVVKRYSHDVRMDVAKELVQSSLFEAISAQALSPAGYPSVDLLELEPNKDLKYAASFEVYPQMNIVDLNHVAVELIKSEVKSSDVDHMIQELQKQNQNWVTVDRAVANGDRVKVHFEGFVDGEAFEGGKAEDYQLILGSGSMIPGFEEGIVGAVLNQPFEVNVTFPSDYNHAPLAGKDALFKMMVTDIQEGQLPELDDEFVARFGVKDGGIDALRKEIQENMERMLERELSSMNRDKIFSKFIEHNPIELPTVLVDHEIHELKHEMFHRLFGNKHSENEKIPDFPRELFLEKANRRVHLGLIFSEYVKKHAITVDKARVDAIIEKMAGAYENADELRQHYQHNKKQMEQIEALALEEMVAEKLVQDMTVTEKMMDYQSVVNPKKEDESKGE